MAETKKHGTAVTQSTFKGNEIIAIVEVDAKGNQINEKPVIAFGKRKLKAILDNVEELQEAYKKL